jgi:hypothetical protein
MLHTKSKGLHSAVLDVHAFLQTGVLPLGWWQKAHKLSPVKKAAAAAQAELAAPKAAPKKAQPRKKAPSKAASTSAATAAAAESDVEMQEVEAAAQPDVPAQRAVLATEAALPEAATESAQVAAPQAVGGATPTGAGDGAAAAAAHASAQPPAASNGGGSLGGAARPAGSGSTSTRDMLRSVFNRIKLLHPAAARLETPNSVVDLLAALRKHFGPAMALATEQLVGERAAGRGGGAGSWVALVLLAGSAATLLLVAGCPAPAPHPPAPPPPPPNRSAARTPTTCWPRCSAGPRGGPLPPRTWSAASRWCRTARC